MVHHGLWYRVNVNTYDFLQFAQPLIILDRGRDGITITIEYCVAAGVINGSVLGYESWLMSELGSGKVCMRVHSLGSVGPSEKSMGECKTRH